MRAPDLALAALLAKCKAHLCKAAQTPQGLAGGGAEGGEHSPALAWVPQKT